MKTKQLPQGWKLKPFLECIEKEASNNKLKIPQKDFLEEGLYPIIDQGDNIIAGYTDNETKIYSEKLPVVVFGDHTRIFKFIDFPFAIGADGTKILVPINELNPKFFYYMLKKLNLPSAGYSRHYKFLKEKSLVIPLLPIQQKIVSTLEKAKQLKEKRKKSIEILDEYVKAVFCEMFLEKKFEEVELRKVSPLQGGFAFKSKDYQKDGIALVKITNVWNDIITWEDKTFVPYDFLEKYSDFELRENDLVISMTRPIIISLNSVKIAQVTKNDLPCLLNQRVGRFKIDKDKINQKYLLYYCYTDRFKNKVNKYCSTSLQPNISSGQINSIKIPLPPLPLQQTFASIVKHVEKLKEKQKKSQEEIEDLFNALIQKAFLGELI